MTYRSRIIKHDFFLNEKLSELPPENRLLFIGLWLCSDREGRLEDRPKRLKAEIFPYEDYEVDTMLTELSKGDDPFIIRYSVNGNNYIWIPKFAKHQSIHPNEKKSNIPPFPGITGNYMELHGTTSGTEKKQSNTVLKKRNTDNSLQGNPGIPCNYMERPGITPSSSSSSSSTSTSTSSSSEEEEEIDNLEEIEKTLIKLVNDLWPGMLILPNTTQFANIEELKQFPEEQILEALAAAKKGHVRQGNWVWIFNRLKNPEQYGVEIKPEGYKGRRSREDWFQEIMFDAAARSQSRGYENLHYLTQEFWNYVTQIDDDKIPRDTIVDAYIESNKQGIGGSEQRGEFILKYLKDKANGQ